MRYEQTAKEFCQALKDLVSNPESLYNFECYLSWHFNDWLHMYGESPEDITEEIKTFSKIS